MGSFLKIFRAQWVVLLGTALWAAEPARYSLGLEVPLTLYNISIPAVSIGMRTSENAWLRLLLTGDYSRAHDLDTTEYEEGVQPVSSTDSEYWRRSANFGLTLFRLLETRSAGAPGFYWGYGLGAAVEKRFERRENLTPLSYSEDYRSARFSGSESNGMQWELSPQMLFGFQFPFARRFVFSAESRLVASWIYTAKATETFEDQEYLVSYAGEASALTAEVGGEREFLKLLQWSPIRVLLVYQW